jgi:hypothetical protein
MPNCYATHTTHHALNWFDNKVNIVGLDINSKDDGGDNLAQSPRNNARAYCETNINVVIVPVSTHFHKGDLL